MQAVVVQAKARLALIVAVPAGWALRRGFCERVCGAWRGPEEHGTGLCSSLLCEQRWIPVSACQRLLTTHPIAGVLGLRSCSFPGTP